MGCREDPLWPVAEVSVALVCGVRGAVEGVGVWIMGGGDWSSEGGAEVRVHLNPSRSLAL